MTKCPRCGSKHVIMVINGYDVSAAQQKLIDTGKAKRGTCFAGHDMECTRCGHLWE